MDAETKSNQKMSVAHQKAMGTIWIVSCDHSQGHLGTGAQAQVSEDHTSRGDQLQYLGVQTIVRLEEETAFGTCGWEQCGGTQPSGAGPAESSRGHSYHITVKDRWTTSSPDPIHHSWGIPTMPLSRL